MRTFQIVIIGFFLLGLIYPVSSKTQTKNFKKLVKNLPPLYSCDHKGKYILSNNHKTWVGAKEACENSNLELAKIRSKVEVTEMKAAIIYFLGPRDESLRTFDNRNWIWLGGNDLHLEGRWEWLDRTPVETWDIPWIRRVGKDNGKHIGGLNGQNAMTFSRWGEFDDSYHNHRRKRRPFACQCPGT